MNITYKYIYIIYNMNIYISSKAIKFKLVRSSDFSKGTKPTLCKPVK